MRAVTYLINLDGSQARLESAAAALGAEGLAFERIPAFDGRALRPQEVEGYDERRAQAYMGRSLRGGEIGCYLSHLDCARRFLASDADLALVFEDDIRLAPGAGQVLGALIGWLSERPGDWDLVNLGGTGRKIVTPLQDFPGGEVVHSLARAHYFPMTTWGLIWSRGGARRFIGDHRIIDAPVDNHFRRWLTATDRGLSVWPPLVLPSSAESDIDDGAGLQRRHLGRSPFYGLIKQRRLIGDKARALLHKARRRLQGPAA